MTSLISFEVLTFFTEDESSLLPFISKEIGEEDRIIFSPLTMEILMFPFSSLTESSKLPEGEKRE